MSQPLHQLSLTIFIRIRTGGVNTTPVTLLSSYREQWKVNVDANDVMQATYLSRFHDLPVIGSFLFLSQNGSLVPCWNPLNRSIGPLLKPAYASEHWAHASPHMINNYEYRPYQKGDHRVSRFRNTDVKVSRSFEFQNSEKGQGSCLLPYVTLQ
jgi:hypothetical protein